MKTHVSYIMPTGAEYFVGDWQTSCIHLYQLKASHWCLLSTYYMPGILLRVV